MSAPAELPSLKANDKVVEQLAKALVDAKRGVIQNVAIIATDPEGVPRVLYGGDMSLTPSVYLGAGMLQARLMQQVLGAPPPLLRVGDMPGLTKQQ